MADVTCMVGDSVTHSNGSYGEIESITFENGTVTINVFWTYTAGAERLPDEVDFDISLLTDMGTHWLIGKEEKPFKWIVEFTVDPTWVADGFDLTEERALDMLANDLQFAYGSELGAKILKAPSKKRIRKVQGHVD